jgi:DNA helicase-2/ATP-dependent DNA helicase PcrA
VVALADFESLGGFLEHVSLVMENADRADGDMVSLMTLHAAKGLEFDTVFLPGWEEGLLPNQRALDESGRAGLEEERRLAHVGLTRAKRRAKIYFASNRRIHGLWNSTVPSRFVDDLPEGDVDVVEAPANFSYGGYGGGSRFDRMQTFSGSTYQTPGWQRAQAHRAGKEDNGYAARRSPDRRGPMMIDGELVAKSTGAASGFSVGGRVLHTKFGPGTVEAVDGNKLTVEFDKAGRKMVLDSFVESMS